MRRDNKVLYEQIMRSVSKTIKHVLNEQAQQNSLYQRFLDKLSSTEIPDYIDSCWDSESSDTWCYYANMAKFEWIDEIAQSLGFDDSTELGKAICDEQGWSYDEDAEVWDELIDSCPELRDVDMDYIQSPIDDMYPYYEYD